MLWRLWRLDCQSIVRACIPFPYTAFYQSFFIFSDSLGGAASHYIDEKTSRKPRCHSHSLHIFGRNQVRIVTIQAIINAGHQRTSGKVVGPIFWGRECEVYLWEMCQKPGNNRCFKKWCVLRRKLEMRVGENWRWEFKVEAVLSIFSHPITSLNFMTPLPARHLIGSGRSQVGPSWFKTVYKYSTPKQEGKSLPSFERFRVFVFSSQLLQDHLWKLPTSSFNCESLHYMLSTAFFCFYPPATCCIYAGGTLWRCNGCPFQQAYCFEAASCLA